MVDDESYFEIENICMSSGWATGGWLVVGWHCSKDRIYNYAYEMQVTSWPNLKNLIHRGFVREASLPTNFSFYGK